MPESPDPAVLAAVAGDSDALEVLLREAGPHLARRIRIAPKWSRSLSVEDVVQVTFLEAYLRVGALRNQTRGGFVAWLETIANSSVAEAIRFLERDKRPDSGRRLTVGAEGQSSRTLLANLALDEAGAATRAGEREQVRLLAAAVEELPESYRRVIRALDLDERDLDDVAEELGRSKGALHMLRARAHDRLREIMTHRMDPR